MKKSKGLFSVFFIVLFLFPIQVFAVDFTIDQTKIDAQLQENGEVYVTETHTYHFDSSFNGITRTLIPKEETSIAEFSASENGSPLEIEQDGDMYRIYRSGKDEVIQIELSYVIKDGVEVYEDMAQFYWPFFDSNNESDYENLEISIHPPQGTSDVIAFGYDAAYGTETIENSGTVHFSLGFVESGEDGDIRVGYDTSLFSAASIMKGTIRSELLEEQQQLADREANYLARQETLRNVAPFINGAFGLFFVLLLFYAWRKKQSTLLEVDRQQDLNASMVPKERMSLPATIYYFRSMTSGYDDLLTTGMMDLVRKGNVKANEDKTYQLVERETEHSHESKLIHLLFRRIGENDKFSFEQLERYAKKTGNQKTLYTDLSSYQGLLKQEIDSHQLFDKHVKLRWFTGIVSLLLIPIAFVFLFHEIFVWCFVSFFLLAGLLAYSFVLKTRTIKGQLIKQEWERFKNDFSAMESNSWYMLSEDDKERALIFTTGMKDQKLIDKNVMFIRNDASFHNDSSYPIFILLLLSSTGHNGFAPVVAVSAASGSSSTSSYTGTGVGGGGGGSGAF